VEPRAYHIQVKHGLALSGKLANLTRPIESANLYDFGSLQTGDPDGSNQIDIVDFSLLRAAFGSPTGCGVAVPNPAPCADYDGTGQVDIVGFSFFRSNFGRRPVKTSTA
jgi:hypothetical protein